MTKSMQRQLEVSINDTAVGILNENNGIWTFTYSAEWLSSDGAFPLSNHLPLQTAPHSDNGTIRHVQWFFDNLLPEEGARSVLAKSEKVDKDDAFALLERVGSESAGAITLLQPGERFTTRDSICVDNEDLASRIANLPKAPLNNTKRKKMSLAGAQNKMLICVDESGQRFEPVGSMPSSHILKPEHSQPDEFWFTVRNEYTVMQLAKQCGLEVSDVAIDYVPAPVYLVKRFDRSGHYPDQVRKHMLDGCQMLGLSPYAKYRQSSLENLMVLVNVTREKVKTAERLFKWVLFNVLVGNSDAHLKNLSFEILPGEVRLAPHYDLLSTIIYMTPHQAMDEELSQPIGNATRYGDITHQSILELAKAFRIPPNRALKEVQRQVRVLTEGIKTAIEHVEALPVYPEKAGELRMLRQIQSIAIAEMSKRLLTP